jgi:hypothetical protein
MAVVCGLIEGRSKFFEIDVVRIGLRRVGSRMPHERLQRDEVTPTLAEEAIGETMSELVRGQGTNTSPPADAFNHPP